MITLVSSLSMYPVQSAPAGATMEKVYSMNDALNGERNMSSPKKENMFHSVYNAFNVLWEQFSKVSASFIASINYPLSVTVVNNEGVIPHDFFKSWTSRKEPFTMYIHNAQVKESLNIVESIHNDIFDEKKPYISRIFNEDTKDNLKFSYGCFVNKNKDAKRSDKKEAIVKENSRYKITNCNSLVPVQNLNKISEAELFEYICPDTDIQEMYTTENCYNFEDISNEEQLSNCINSSMDDKTIMDMEIFFSIPNTNTLTTQSVQQAAAPNLFKNIIQKVVSGVTDRFCRTNSVESDLTMKRSFSPKQRRKLNTVAKGRGRGRAKSQLRRSGVSQTRHRKERTKHDIAVDIESDYKSWQELEMYHTTENKESEDCFTLDEDTVDAVQYIIKETVSPVYTLADVKPKIQKPKTRRNVNQGLSKCPAKMRSIPECTEETNIFDYDFVENKYNWKNTFRPRLVSESSIDSEDSYCIVFETSSEVTCKSDLEDSEDSEESEESDIDQISEDEETCRNKEPVSSAQKVKFNLNPVVHVMVQWDYAYRAARKGPWEQMARDRDRFRGRINCIERVLSPILSVQHRTHIWQERFALTE